MSSTVRDATLATLRCASCERLPVRPVMFQSCGHSVYCAACAQREKPKKCPECDDECKRVSSMKANTTLSAILEVMFIDGDQDCVTSKPDEEVLQLVRVIASCTVCKRVPARPVMFPRCCHSTDCEACVLEKKPKRCGICAEERKVSFAKLTRNHSLEALLRVLLHDDYEDREYTNESQGEIARRKDLERLEASVELWSDELYPDYQQRATELLTKHYNRSGRSDPCTWCDCGLLRLPALARLKNRYFLACPRKPPLNKRIREETSEEDVAAPDTMYEIPVVQKKSRPPRCGFHKWLGKNHEKLD